MTDTQELLPPRIWLKANSESRFGVGAVWSPTLEPDYNIEYVRADLVRTPSTSPKHQDGDWRFMESAPRNAVFVEVQLKNGTMLEAHWAQDYSGEHQAPFDGWFDRNQIEIDTPVRWRPLSPSISLTADDSQPAQHLSDDLRKVVEFAATCIILFANEGDYFRCLRCDGESLHGRSKATGNITHAKGCPVLLANEILFLNPQPTVESA